MSAGSDSPAISIVMPCFNAAAHLATSVGSVLSQTFTDWELIVVDDGSTDSSHDWLAAQTDHRIHYLRQPNQGVSAARNAGLKQARAEYVAFLDADDTWAPGFLQKLFEALCARPDAVLAYCGWQNKGLPGGRGEPFVPLDYETPDKQVTLFAGCRWPVHAALARRDAILKVGGFNQDLKNAEDYAVWLEVAGTAPIVRVPEVLAYYHFHGANQASTNRARAALQLLSAQRDYLERHPGFGASLGRTRQREIMYGGLLRTGFDCYWQDDLCAARTLFRRTMAACYGPPKSWLYMLPAMLPIWLHRALLARRRHSE